MHFLQGDGKRKGDKRPLPEIDLTTAGKEGRKEVCPIVVLPRAVDCAVNCKISPCWFDLWSLSKDGHSLPISFAV